MKSAAAIFFVLVHSVCSAEFYDGRKVADWSSAYERTQAGTSRTGDHQDAAKLLGYVAGVADTSVAVKILCIPTGTTIGQLMAMTSKYAKENPEKWLETANNTIFAALYPTFKCD